MFPQIFGKYVLEREIAAGGMARVYLATLRGAGGFEKRLVVKQIRTELADDDAFVRRFVEEAKIAVELSHPNIVPVYELGVEQGVYYIAMELCEGLTLADVLAETGALSREEGAYLGVEICRALDYAHRRAGVVHRDVTPRNVLLDEEGAVRVIDFGIAAPVLSDSPGGAGVFGSPGHMPPEQLRGATLSPATDVFAVGALLIEAWTGRPPFRRATAKECALALEAPPARLEAHDPRLKPLAGLIESTVALDPSLRPASAELLSRPLRDYLRTADVGDVARRLGERVREARRAASRSEAWAPTPTATGAAPATPARPKTEPGASATRTFAARQDLQVWTRKLLSEPPPAATSRAPSGRARTGGERGRFLAMTGLLSLGGLLVLLGTRTPEPSARAHSQPEAALAAPAAAPAERTRVASLAAPPSAAADTVPATPEASALPAGTRSRAATGEPRATADRGATAPVESARGETTPSRAEPRSGTTSAASDEPAQFGTLKITADPQASVSISGARFWQQRDTPVLGLEVPVGSYQLTFSSRTYGGSVGARVSVVAGSHREVHADFREIEPLISVH